MGRRREPQAGNGTDGAEGISAFELDQHLFFWLTQVLDRRDRQLALELKPDDLRVPEWRVLASLYSRHHLSMSELADLTSIDRTTLSRTVERMVRRGWLVRLSDTSDMRVTRLAPTAAGARLFQRIWPVVQRLNETAVATLPEPAVALVRWALGEMRGNLDRSLAAETTKRTEKAEI